MKPPLTLLDESLLYLTKRISDAIYYWVGITSLTLSLLCFVSLVVTIYFGMIVDILGHPSSFRHLALALIVIPSCSFVTFFLWKSIVKKHAHIQAGFMNPLREVLFSTRVLNFLFAVISSGDVFRLVFSDVSMIEKLLRTPTLFSSTFFLLSSALYFASVQPEPPSESRLSKGLNKLKSIFSAALPSPS